MARSFLRESNVNFLGNFIKPKRFNDTIDGVTIYAENKDVNGHLYNIYIRKNNKEDFEITYAKRGLFDFPSGTPVLILFEGETIKNKNNKITNFKFSKSDFLLKNLQTNTITKQKTQEMKTKDILSCIIFLYELKINFLSNKNNQIVNCREGNKINMLKEFYKRLVVPLYIPVLMLVPYILVFSSKEKINYSKLKIFTFLLGVMIIIISEGLIRFISTELANNTIILASPFIVFITLYFVFIYRLIFFNK